MRYQTPGEFTAKLPPPSALPTPAQVVGTLASSFVGAVKPGVAAVEPFVAEPHATKIAPVQSSFGVGGRAFATFKTKVLPPVPLSLTRMRIDWFAASAKLKHDEVAPQGEPPQSSLQKSSMPPHESYTEMTVSVTEVQELMLNVVAEIPFVNEYHTSFDARPPESHEAAPSFVAKATLPGVVPTLIGNAFAHASLPGVCGPMTIKE